MQMIGQPFLDRKSNGKKFYEEICMKKLGVHHNFSDI
jgi:hypothetical protein